MKTKFKCYGKRTVSVILSLMMIVSCMILGQIATLEASAETWTNAEGTGTYVYVYTNSSNDVYAHFWIENGNNDIACTNWPGNKLEPVSGLTGVYRAEIPRSTTNNTVADSVNFNYNGSGFTGDLTVNANHVYDTDGWFDYSTYSINNEWYIVGNFISNGNTLSDWNSLNDNFKLTTDDDGASYYFTSNTTYTTLYNNSNSYFRFRNVIKRGGTVRTNNIYATSSSSWWLTYTDISNSNSKATSVAMQSFTNTDNTFCFNENGFSSSSDAGKYVKLTINNASTSPTLNVSFVDPNYTNISVNAKLGSTTATNSSVTFTGAYASQTSIVTLPGGTILGLTAPTTIDDYTFQTWETSTGTLANATSATTATFTPSQNDATVTAVYAKQVTYAAGTAVTKDENGNTSSATGGTFNVTPTTATFGSATVTTTPGSEYKVNAIHYSYTKTDDSTVTGSVTTATSTNTYTIEQPSDVKGGATITVYPEFQKFATVKVSAYVDNTYGTPGTVSITYNGETVTTTSGTPLVTMQVKEGERVTFTVTDADNTADDTIIDKFVFSGDFDDTTIQSSNSDSLSASRYYDSSSPTTSLATFTASVVPTGNMTACAYFKEDEGREEGSHYILYGNTSQDNFTQFSHNVPIYKTYAEKYRAYINNNKDGFTFGNGNHFFAISDSTSWRDVYPNSSYEHYNSNGDNDPGFISKSSIEAEDDFKPYLANKFTKEQGGNDDLSGRQFFYIGYAVKNAVIDTLIIKMDNLSGYNYTLSANLTPVEENPTTGNATVIAKDGTLRDSYLKYADIGDTKILSAGDNTRAANNSIDGNAIDITAYKGRAETVKVAKGQTIKFGTNIPDATNNSKYYVKAFNVNGTTVLATPETYNVKSYNASGTEITTSIAGYTGEYTIPADTADSKIEITPIYYYNTSYNGLTADDFITFYVENFDDDAKAAWGEDAANGKHAILAVYAYYINDQGKDVLAAGAADKPALGGYPGQPMVYENGRYTMQIPKSNNGHTVLGITMNNYIWDEAHAGVLSANSKTANAQTYDYDDFAALSQLIASDTSRTTYSNSIIFRFKYNTAENKKDNNRNAGNIPLADSTGSNLNGYEVYTDYNGNAIDLRNNILIGNYSSVEKVESKSTYYKIVSDGYRDMYYGHYAVMWNVYKVTTSNNTTTTTRVAQLPSSAFFTDLTGKLDSNGNIASNATAPDSFCPNGDWNNDPNTDKTAYWNVYKTLYNEAKDIPVIITYETSMYAGDVSGHPNDPGNRCDGRWYFSRVSEKIAAKIRIEYTTPSGSDFIVDEYKAVDGDVRGYQGTVTGAHAYFTNTGVNNTTENVSMLYKTKVTNVTKDESSNFTFAADDKTNPSGNLTVGYQFIGWYIEQDGVLSELDPDQAKYYFDQNGTNESVMTSSKTPMIGDTTLVARYAYYEVEDLNISLISFTHDLYSKAQRFTNSPALNGTGSGTTTVSVAYKDGSTAPTAFYSADDGSEVAFTLGTGGLDSSKTLVITLTTTPDATSEVSAVYRKYNSDDNEAGDVDANGYQSYDAATPKVGPNAISNWSVGTRTTNSDGSVTTKYEIKVSDLVDNGAFKSDVVHFYSDIAKAATTKTINVYFKYYDRDTSESAHSKPATVSEKPTTVTVAVDVPISPTLNQLDRAVFKAYTTIPENGSQPVSEITSVIDDYYFWTTQDKAKAGIAQRKNHHDGDNNYAESVIHADPYGFIGDDSSITDTSKYNKAEKWVTYYTGENGTGTEASNVSDTNSIVVWGFNTPKEYDVKIIKPINNVLSANCINTTAETINGAEVFLANDEADESYVYNSGKITNYYNVRLGRTYNEAGVDALPTYLQKVFTGNESLANYNGSNTSDSLAFNEAPEYIYSAAEGTAGRVTYVFDGWYDENNTKISSDRIFADRILNEFTIRAGYVVYDENADIPCGLTVTKGETEFYVEKTTGTQMTRLVTEVNCYGYPDSDANFKDIGIVYILLQKSGSQEFTDSEIDTIIGKIFNWSGMRTALNSDHSEGSTTKKAKVSVEGNNGQVLATIITYDVASSQNTDTMTGGAGSGTIKLTNKNRTQFTLNVPTEQLEEGDYFSDVVALVVYTHDDDENNSIDNGTLTNGTYVDSEIYKSNYVRYIEGE